MNIIVLDFETFYSSTYSLSKITTEDYIRHDQFEVIGVSVKVDAGETRWFSGTKAQTNKFLAQFDWANSVAVAHNAMFDAAILSWHFDIQPKRIADTLSMARALLGTEGISLSLKSLAEYFGLGIKGTEVQNALGKGRLDFTPEELSRYGEYCINDTELTYELFKQLADGFPMLEFRLIDLTLRMFTEPKLELDICVLEDHLRSVQEKKQGLLSKIASSKQDIMSNPKLAQVLKDLGVTPPMKISPTTGKETYAFAKSDEGFKELLEHEDILIQALVAARLGVKSTLEETRTERFINIAGRGPLPIPLRYYAAHTGRWGGDDKVNMQNLPRKSPLKKAIRAPDGYLLVDCDSSQIEARTLAWLAGQDDLIEAFDRGEDVYKIMASAIYGKPVEEITEQERFVGKTTILGCFGPDTNVLTNNGWKRIVEVQATDMLWDGEEWVTHQGLVPQGEKEVLIAQGLTATLGHEMLTEHGWQAWSEVATNPSLFQSAINRAAWRSLDGSNTLNPQGDQPDGIQLSAVRADGKDLLTDTTSKQDAQLGVTPALEELLTLQERNTGGTKLSCLTSNTANAYSTEYQAALGVAITQKLKPIPTMEVGVSMYTPLGSQNGGTSYVTSYPLKGGKTTNSTSTVSIITEGTNPVICGSLPEATTQRTSGQQEVCRQKSMTYDIAYAGPRNRYTVATDAGPIIVHNCGYGMGAAKFKAQLKTFNVDMELNECTRIISVYRETYPRITALWKQAGRVLDAMISGQTAPLGLDGVLLVDEQGIKLPNGLYIKYPRLRRRADNKTGRDEMVYDTKKGRATIPTRIYGGKCVENVCQALARIIIGEQMLMVARRLPVVMTVHDAVGALVKIEDADEGRKFVEQCMRIRPKWAAKLPLNCESKIGASYGK